MKPVKKYSNFQELKSIGKKSVDVRTAMEKHKAFEILIKGIAGNLNSDHNPQIPATDGR